MIRAELSPVQAFKYIRRSQQQQGRGTNGQFRRAMIVHDHFTQYTWLYFLGHESVTIAECEQLISDVRGHGDVEYVRTDDGEAFTSKAFRNVINHHSIKKGLATVDSPQPNGVTKLGLGIVRKTAMAGRTDTSLLFSGANISSAKNLWTEAMLWTCDSLNRSDTTANPDCTNPFEFEFGTKTPI